MASQRIVSMRDGYPNAQMRHNRHAPRLLARCKETPDRSSKAKH